MSFIATKRSRCPSGMTSMMSLAANLLLVVFFSLHYTHKNNGGNLTKNSLKCTDQGAFAFDCGEAPIEHKLRGLLSPEERDDSLCPEVASFAICTAEAWHEFQFIRKAYDAGTCINYFHAFVYIPLSELLQITPSANTNYETCVLLSWWSKNFT